MIPAYTGNHPDDSVTHSHFPMAKFKLRRRRSAVRIALSRIHRNPRAMKPRCPICGYWGLSPFNHGRFIICRECAWHALVCTGEASS